MPSSISSKIDAATNTAENLSVLMLYLWAIVFPPAVFFTANQPGAGIINLFLWLTCCGSPFASGWALWVAAQYLEDERIDRLADAFREGSRSGRRRRDDD